MYVCLKYGSPKIWCFRKTSSQFKKKKHHWGVVSHHSWTHPYVSTHSTVDGRLFIPVIIHSRWDFPWNKPTIRTPIDIHLWKPLYCSIPYLWQCFIISKTYPLVIWILLGDLHWIVHSQLTFMATPGHLGSHSFEYWLGIYSWSGSPPAAIPCGKLTHLRCFKDGDRGATMTSTDTMM